MRQAIACSLAAMYLAKTPSGQSFDFSFFFCLFSSFSRKRGRLPYGTYTLHGKVVTVDVDLDAKKIQWSLNGKEIPEAVLTDVAVEGPLHFTISLGKVASQPFPLQPSPYTPHRGVNCRWVPQRPS